MEQQEDNLVLFSWTCCLRYGFGQLSGLSGGESHLSDSEELHSSPIQVWAVLSRVVLLPACLAGISQHSLFLSPLSAC